MFFHFGTQCSHFRFQLGQRSLVPLGQLADAVAQCLSNGIDFLLDVLLESGQPFVVQQQVFYFVLC